MNAGVRALVPIAVTFAVLFAILYWTLGGLVERRQSPNAEIPVGAGGPQRIELVANPAGQFVVPGEINGRKVDFLVDTGASHVAVPARLAREVGLERGAESRVQTASGSARAYYTTIDRVAVGGIVRRNVRGSIVPSMPGNHALLGMSFLRGIEFRQTGDRLVLEQP